MKLTPKTFVKKDQYKMDIIITIDFEAVFE